MLDELMWGHSGRHIASPKLEMTCVCSVWAASMQIYIARLKIQELEDLAFSCPYPSQAKAQMPQLAA